MSKRRSNLMGEGRHRSIFPINSKDFERVSCVIEGSPLIFDTIDKAQRSFLIFNVQPDQIRFIVDSKINVQYGFTLKLQRISVIQQHDGISSQTKRSGPRFKDTLHQTIGSLCIHSAISGNFFLSIFNVMHSSLL